MRDFLKACSHRLETGSIASRVFNSDGAELDDIMLLDDDGMVFLSTGEDFIRPGLKVSEDTMEGASQDENMPVMVGGYQVGSLLGKGGFGEVRVGSHQLTGEKVALKFLKKSEIMSMGAAERTVTEIQCLMAMRHANIIRLYQHVESMHHYVLIFELMVGGDLWGYQRNLPELRGQQDMAGLPPMALTEDEARAVFQQIVSGVAYAHNQHICHRDLKLENILLKNKNLESVKIADFGLSAFYRPGAALMTNCGTLSFLAPEVFKGTSNAGPPLDVWALGVILFSLLCGRLPFEGTDLSYKARPKSPVIRGRILKCQYKIDEYLSPEVKDLVRRMLRLDPTERASVPEIFNHFWLRGSSSGPGGERGERGVELKKDKSGSTIFQTLGGFSRESSAKSTRGPSPIDKNIDIQVDTDSLDAILDSLDGEAGVTTKINISLIAPMLSDSDGTPEVTPKVFKLVPLRRATVLTGSSHSVDGAGNGDSPGAGRPGSRPPVHRAELSNPTTRRAQAMLNDKSDSLRDLTDAVSRRETVTAPSNAQNATNMRGEQGREIRSGRVRSTSSNHLSTLGTDYKNEFGTPPEPSSPFGSPKHSAQGSPKNTRGTFFTAGTASLNTHSSVPTTRARSMYDSPARAPAGPVGRTDYK
jgi:serine/threonine protein kinase